MATTKATTKTTTKAKAQTRKTATSAKQTAKQAERTVRTVVLDGAYATVGLGDTAVETLRQLPVKAAQLRNEAPKKVRSLTEDAPRDLKDLTARAKVFRTTAERELDAYATRGRKVVQAIRGSASTQKALEQSRTARSQVKAATTSVRKAVKQSAVAVDTATGKVGDQAR